MITEALLEMFYFRALMDCFQSVFGVRFRRLLKPSQQRETWVGFDQGWVRTSLTSEELFSQLRASVRSGIPLSERFFLGYFLQFKCVQAVHRRSRYCPDGVSPSYYRVELSLKPNAVTGLSQHETLLRLRNLPKAFVYYGCPMMFDEAAIYDEPDLDLLQCVDVNTAPDLWRDDERHFIVFRKPNEPQPLWCSEPSPGTSVSFTELTHRNAGEALPRLDPSNIEDLIRKSVAEILLAMPKSDAGQITRAMKETMLREPTRILPESLTIMEFSLER